MKKYFLILLIVSITIIASCKNQANINNQINTNAANELEEFGISIGNKAPDFELRGYDGKTISLSVYKGSPVVLDFFASWCPYCNNEMPRINKIVNEKYPNVKIIAINDAFEDAKTIEAWAKEKGFDFPLLVDPEGKVKALYAIRGHPTTIYIDKEGIIKDKRYGSGANAVIEENLKKITT
ncbi:TlpA family protein disulfide reductase [Candidatus Woesearchaeota archaeon]|nr:TlpA family protein disulfide reductase [Candidatus Woesearchaeota archaeon]